MHKTRGRDAQCPIPPACPIPYPAHPPAPIHQGTPPPQPAAKATPAMTSPTQSDSFITLDSNGAPIAFVGPDATELVRAIMLKSALTLWHRTKIITTRGCTITYMIGQLPRYTGRAWTRKELPQAIAALDVWIENMKMALPQRHVGDTI